MMAGFYALWSETLYNCRVWGVMRKARSVGSRRGLLSGQRRAAGKLAFGQSYRATVARIVKTALTVVPGAVFSLALIDKPNASRSYPAAWLPPRYFLGSLRSFSRLELSILSEFYV